MTDGPTWAILVPTLGERTALFERLMGTLLPQTEPYGGRVKVHAWHNNGAPPLPEIRQRMIMSAQQDYVNFADDDDLVTPDYVAEIVNALQTRPDYVGFQVQCYSDGFPTAVDYHSLEFKTWRNLNGRFERDISHINPIRASLAKQVSFMRAGRRAEDRVWADQLRRSGVLQTQVLIPRILYHYLYSTSHEYGQGSRWEQHRRVHRGNQSLIEHPNLEWVHP